ncbi:MAG: hypothetical protein JWN37_321 [Candidatus Nomurabacteria bacterium]|nr:hypothetical protein [Candidatus Nomurabacteria bacterium]
MGDATMTWTHVPDFLDFALFKVWPALEAGQIPSPRWIEHEQASLRIEAYDAKWPPLLQILQGKKLHGFRHKGQYRVSLPELAQVVSFETRDKDKFDVVLERWVSEWTLFRIDLVKDWGHTVTNGELKAQTFY